MVLCLTHLMIWSLQLKLNFEWFLSNKTPISFILTCSGVNPHQWGSEAEHGEESSRPVPALFSPLLSFGQGAVTSFSSPHHMQAGLLPQCFLEKATQAAQSAPISSSQAVTNNVPADRHHHKHHHVALAPWPYPATSAQHRHHPSPGPWEVSFHFILL